MSFAIFIWVLMVVFVMGIFAWSLHILFAQKRAWKAFAKRYKLEYQSNALLQSPVVSGLYKDYEISLYSEEQPTTDASRKQFRSIILFHFSKKFPAGGIIGTKGYTNFIESLNIKHTYKPDHPKWKSEYVVQTPDEKKLEKFMTNDRYGAILKLFGIKNSESLFVFDEEQAYFRFETSDPLQDLNKLDKFIKKIKQECDVLLPNKK